MLDENNLFRDVFSEAAVTKLAGGIKRVWKPFRAGEFADEINRQLSALNFGARSALIAETLAKYLPRGFADAAEVLIRALPPEPEGDSLSGFNGFIIMPQCDFVAKYGIDEPDTALNALYEMTKRFTAEGQIRAFLRRYPEKTMRFLHKLTKDPSPFARRLASEGTRPRLPLGSRLHEFITDPTPVLEILEKLKDDPNPMVRRSVANNLNDIAKDNPGAVTETLRRWKKSKNPDTQWLIKHAARTLLKQGNKDIMELFGYVPGAALRDAAFSCKPGTLAIGDTLTLKLSFSCPKAQKIMIDYIIHYQKANGKTAPKVFKWSVKNVAAGEKIALEKKHSFKPISTREYYEGLHHAEVVINGTPAAPRQSFMLRKTLKTS